MGGSRHWLTNGDRQNRLPPVGSMLWFAVPTAVREPFLDGSDVEPRNGQTAVIIKPYDDPAATRVEPGMIGRRHWVSSSTGGHNGEGFKRRDLQLFAKVTNHMRNLRRLHSPRNGISRLTIAYDALSGSQI